MHRVINADGRIYREDVSPVLFYEIDVWIQENLAHEVCMSTDCKKHVNYYIDPSPLPCKRVTRVDTLEACIELRLRASCGKHEHVIMLPVPDKVIIDLAKHRFLPLKRLDSWWCIHVQNN